MRAEPKESGESLDIGGSLTHAAKFNCTYGLQGNSHVENIGQFLEVCDLLAVFAPPRVAFLWIHPEGNLGDASSTVEM